MIRTFPKKYSFEKNTTERVHAKKHILKKTFYLGHVIKLLIFVNENIKYDIY